MIRLSFQAISIVLGLSVLVQTPAATAADVTAFVSVNVVPMDRDRVMRGQTVLIENGTIKAIGAAVIVPKGAPVIDGHGTAFLSPGLADMHSHSDTPEDLVVYLASGVTTILNMGGDGWPTQRGVWGSRQN